LNLPPACSSVSAISAAERLGSCLSSIFTPVGMPRPLSDHADGVVGVDGDHDVVAVAGQRFVDGVVHHLEHQVVQAGAVGRVADVHAGALAHGLQAFQDLDGAFAVAFAGASLVGVDFWHNGLTITGGAVLDGLVACCLRSWWAFDPWKPAVSNMFNDKKWL
jgi:hypothetical protein